MIFVGVRSIANHTIIDGYSKARTIRGAIKDLAREIAKHNPLGVRRNH